MDTNYTAKSNQGLTILIFTTAILTVINLIVWLFSYLSRFEYQSDLVLATVGLSLAYLLVSWRFWEPIQADEMGVRDILGKPYDRVDAGPPFAPIGLVNIQIYPTTTPQREFPGEPQKLYYPKEGESDTPPEGSGLVRPLRIPFAGKPLRESEARQLFGENFSFRFKGQDFVFAEDTAESDDGLSNSRVTAVVSHICRFRIYDPVRFTIAVPPNEETGSRIDEVFSQIEDEQVIALSTILTQMTIAQAIKNISWINAVLYRKVCRRIGAVNKAAGEVDDSGHSTEWGIDLEGSAVKPFEFNRKLNSAITGVAQAAFDAVTTLRTAEAAKQAGILAGQSAASAARDLEQATLEGRAAGLNKIGEVMKTEEGRAAQAAEVARAVADGGNTIVVGTSGVTEIIGLAAAAAKAIKKKE